MNQMIGFDINRDFSWGNLEVKIIILVSFIMSALTTNSDLIIKTSIYDYQGQMMGWTEIDGGQNIIFCSSLEQIDLSSWNAFFLEPWDLSAISVRHTIWSWSTCQDIKNYVTKNDDCYIPVNKFSSYLFSKELLSDKCCNMDIVIHFSSTYLVRKYIVWKIVRLSEFIKFPTSLPYLNDLKPIRNCSLTYMRIHSF